MDNIEVGSEVYARGTGWNNSIYTYTVKRETKTMWVLCNGNKYYKESLRQYGDRYSGNIKLLTDKIRQEIKIIEKKRSVTDMMYQLGNKRNKVDTDDFGDLRRAELKLKEVFQLLGIERSK